MSKDAIAAFLTKALEDQELRKELVELAGRHGYAFTVDELDDSELSSVAGGFLKIETIQPILQKEFPTGSLVFDKH